MRIAARGEHEHRAPARGVQLVLADRESCEDEPDEREELADEARSALERLVGGLATIARFAFAAAELEAHWRTASPWTPLHLGAAAQADLLRHMRKATASNPTVVQTCSKPRRRRIGADIEPARTRARRRRARRRRPSVHARGRGTRRGRALLDVAPPARSAPSGAKNARAKLIELAVEPGAVHRPGYRGRARTPRRAARVFGDGPVVSRTRRTAADALPHTRPHSGRGAPRCPPGRQEARASATSRRARSRRSPGRGPRRSSCASRSRGVECSQSHQLPMRDVVLAHECAYVAPRGRARRPEARIHSARRSSPLRQAASAPRRSSGRRRRST